MFSRHFNDPAADSYFTKRKWGEFVFSPFFGPTVFSPLLHFYYQCSISSICAFFFFFLQHALISHGGEFFHCFFVSICACRQPLAFCAQTPRRPVQSRETDADAAEDVLCVFDSWPVCVFASVTRWAFEETVAETKPVAGAIWPTYRNTHRGSKTIQTPRRCVSGENITSKLYCAPGVVQQQQEEFGCQPQHSESATVWSSATLNVNFAVGIVQNMP